MAPPPKSETEEFGFLGDEFLLWLWWCSETRGGLYVGKDDVRIGFALDRALEFLDEVSGVKVLVRGDAPTRAPEAREALSRGMRLKRAGLIVTVGGENVALVLDGESLDLRSIRVEPSDSDPEEDRDEAALGALFGLVDSIDVVFRQYLLERASPEFLEQGAARLLDWARRAADPTRRRAVEGAAEASPAPKPATEVANANSTEPEEAEATAG